jgi:hypothetical protein
MCIAYGADPKLFGDVVAKRYLPKERAEGCADEYHQAAFAFETLIGPHLDRKLAQKVLRKSWLPTPKAYLSSRPQAIVGEPANRVVCLLDDRSLM